MSKIYRNEELPDKLAERNFKFTNELVDFISQTIDEEDPISLSIVLSGLTNAFCFTISQYYREEGWPKQIKEFVETYELYMKEEREERKSRNQ